MGRKEMLAATLINMSSDNAAAAWFAYDESFVAESISCVLGWSINTRDAMNSSSRLLFNVTDVLSILGSVTSGCWCASYLIRYGVKRSILNVSSIGKNQTVLIVRDVMYKTDR